MRLKDEEFFMKAFVDLEAKYKRGEKKLKQEYVRYNIPRSGSPIWMWWILKSLCIQRFFHHENQTVQIIFTKNFVNPKIFVKLISLKKQHYMYKLFMIYSATLWDTLYYDAQFFNQKNIALTEVAGEGGTDCPPQKFLSSQKFRHLMGWRNMQKKIFYLA